MINKKILPIFFLVFTFCSQTNQEQVLKVGESQVGNQIEPTETTISSVDPPKYYLNEKNIPIQNNLYHTSFDSCIDFLGSNQKVSCEGNYESIKSVVFEEGMVNTLIHNNHIYVVIKKGVIYKYDYENDNKSIFFESENILNKQEAGLLGIAISESNNTFAISYVNSDSLLVVDRYKYESYEKINEFLFDKRLFEQEMKKPYTHIGGNIIWSKYFQSYLLSVGDNQEPNEFSRVNPVPLATDSNLGKIVALKDLDIDVPIIRHSEEDKIVNALAFGLRNPWQFFEYRDYLIIADVGLSINEELNVVKLNNLPASFGWPIFEGGSTSKDIDNIEDYKLDINYYVNSNKISTEETYNKLYKESVNPAFFYNHYPTENDYRAAIIGGDIILDNDSKYIFNIVTVDINTNELFLYNLTSRELTLIPPIEKIGSTTSIRSFSNGLSDLVASTFEGNLLFLKINE